MSSDEESVLSSIAEDRRRHVEEAQLERQRQVARSTSTVKNELVQANNHGEVAFTISPSLLPYTVIDGNEFISQMAERFGVRFKLPQVNLPLGQDRAPGFSREQIADFPRYVTSGDLRLEFEDGLVSLNVGREDFVPPTAVRAITFTRENITASVVGRSDIAEMIAKECWELLWNLAKGQTPRTFDELAKAGLQIVSHGNSTTIDLGANPKELFKVEFISTIERLFGSKDSLSANLREYVYSDQAGLMPHDPVVNLDEIQFKVHVSNASGSSDEAPIRLSVTRRADGGTNLISLVTQLPYDDHLLAVNAIVDSLK